LGLELDEQFDFPDGAGKANQRERRTARMSREHLGAQLSAVTVLDKNGAHLDADRRQLDCARGSLPDRSIEFV
jgi:hypothetical protein